MQIAFDKAVDGVLDYMSGLVVSIPKKIDKWLGVAAVAGLKKNPEPLKAKVKPWLEMAGILDNGMVDLKTLKASLEAAFREVPSIDYFGFTFTVEDVPALVAKMQQGDTPATATTEAVE